MSAVAKSIRPLRPPLNFVPRHLRNPRLVMPTSPLSTTLTREELAGLLRSEKMGPVYVAPAPVTIVGPGGDYCASYCPARSSSPFDWKFWFTSCLYLFVGALAFRMSPAAWAVLSGSVLLIGFAAWMIGGTRR